MAKRKRASLKDKGTETLGTPQKRSKGLDLLFGEAEASPESVGSGQPVSSTTLDIIGGVDELGLPVAMEEPPDDLILASPSITGEQGATSLPNLEDASVDTEVNELSGLVQDANSPNAEDENLSDSLNQNDLSGLVDEGVSPGPIGVGIPSGGVVNDPANDLSGLIIDDSVANDLSGLTTADPANDLSGLVVDDAIANDLSGLVLDETTASLPVNPPADAPVPISTAQPVTNTPPPAPFTPSTPLPSTTAAPIDVGVPTPLPGVQPSSIPVNTSTTFPPVTTSSPIPTSPAVSTIPPPSTETGAPDMTAPRPATPIKLEVLDAGVAETLSAFGEDLTRKDFQPKDTLPTHDISLDDLMLDKTEHKVSDLAKSYFKPELWGELKEEIEGLLNKRIPNELAGSHSKDVELATTLSREAMSLFVEAPLENYDDILYRLAIVKTMLVNRNRVQYWSYRLGIFIFLYAIIFIGICIYGYSVLDVSSFEAFISPELAPVFLAVWYTGLTGGLGGSVEILWRLYFRVSVKQDFDPQYLMYYLVKPVLGFVLGLVMYFLVALSTSILGTGTGAEGSTLPSAENTVGFALTIVLGFVAGYQQEFVFDMIYTVIKKIAPQKASRTPTSVAPIETITDSDSTITIAS